MPSIDPSVYDRYRGEYVPLNFEGPTIVVSRDGDRLLGRFSGEWLEMLPESEVEYFIPGRGVTIRFRDQADLGAQEISLTLPELPFLVLKARRVE